MSDSRHQPPCPAPPRTPPMMPGPLMAPPGRSIWPTVIGVVSIVVGAGGILGGIFGVLVPFMMEIFGKFMLEGQLEAIGPWMPLMVLSSLLASAVAVLLLIGGIQLVRRRRAARRFLNIWAVVKILTALIAAWIATEAQTAQFAAISRSSSAPSGFQGGFFTHMAGFSFVLTVLWGWMLPVFTIIWFRRARIRSEIAGWT